MKTKTEATIEDLYRVEGKAEIVNGEIVYMSPTGRFPGYAGDEIYAGLREYARRTKDGYAVGDNKSFVVNLPNRKSFSPDAGFYIGGDARSEKFYEGAPIFAAEVRSAGVYGPAAETWIAAKRTDYFAAGTQVVWDVDVLGEIAEAEPAVPGWTMPVDGLYP